MNRRGFLGAAVVGTCVRPNLRAQPAKFPVRFRKPPPYAEALSHIEPGSDEFACERLAAEVNASLGRLLQTGSLPLAPEFRGASPAPLRYSAVADGVTKAEFGGMDSQSAATFAGELKKWVESLGKVRSSRFHVLAGGVVRYEIAAGLQYRVGRWKLGWNDTKLTSFEPLEEIVTTTPKPLFRDVTAHAFGANASFREQMLRGVPYWRARIDSAAGIDVYGNNGIAVGDVDNDGWDEVYVCQPGGLPNRLYKNRGDGRFDDVTDKAGVSVLDDTASALFVDFRNAGLQDLVVLRASGPLLFVNQGDGTFRPKDDAFRFGTQPQGAFTGMSAADYDRDGRVDLYLCSYVYFQSEDQYRYPAPYHDARNGPPNFLFRNTADGVFEDVTAAVGLGENNDRYSFAAAWCDYDGDGWPDLYVANDFGVNNLYKNEGGRFRDVAAAAGVEDLGPGMSAAWFDYNGDGRPDLYVSNMWSAAGQRVADDPAFALPRAPYKRHAKGNSLFRNRGDGTFEETPGVEMGRWAWSADAHDFDNDGAPEIYCTCGMLTNSSDRDLMSFFWRQVVARSPAEAKPQPEYENGWNAINQLIREDYSWNGREPNVFYAQRNGKYYDFSGVSGLDYADDSRAFAVTDMDGDGNLDILLKSRLGPQVRALHNDCGSAGRSLGIVLRGTKSNRDGIGARVEVDGQVNFVQAGSGYLSQHTKTLYFGLRGRPGARRVRIDWPSGTKQQFAGLEASHLYEIEEGSGQIRKSAMRAHRAVAGSVPLRADNRPRATETWMLDPVPLPVARTGPGLVRLTAEDLRTEPEETAAAFALFRRYLFDWRTELELPAAYLIDERGMVHKFYPVMPGEAKVREDLVKMRGADREKLALPFAGRYVTRPHRNYFRLGAAFQNAGYPEPALRYLAETLKSAPENVVALLAVGQLELEAGRHERARGYLEKALRLRPESASGWNNLGGVELAAGNPLAALRHYEKALRFQPVFTHAEMNAAEAENQIGLDFARQGRTADARAAFERAIARRKDHAGAINNLGVLYMQMEHTNDATAAFQYGISVAPQDDILYINLAKVHARRGDRDKAAAVLLKLLDLKPGHAVARRALEELSK